MCTEVEMPDNVLARGAVPELESFPLVPAS